MTVPIEQGLGWIDEATDRIITACRALREQTVRAPSLLPGWSRAALMAHIGHNAAALMNLLRWAQTGVPTPMYESRGQRERDIASASEWTHERLVDFVTTTAEKLRQCFANMTDSDWQAIVVTARGREVPANEIVWMRLREVAVHSIDLDLGLRFESLPSDVLDALIADATASLGTRPGAPSLMLRSASGSWEVRGNGAPTIVRGERADLAAWLTGRASGERLKAQTDVPSLGPWL